MSKKSNYTIYRGAVDCSPEEQNYDPAQLDVLDAHYMRLMDEDLIQCGSYIMARNGRIFAKRSLGKLCGYEDKGDMKPDSIRRIASITKVFTATAIMQLMEKGKLHLTMPVSTILKEFNTSIHKDITLWQMLTHTSGLAADPGAYLEPYPYGWWNMDDDKSGYNWIQKILTGPLQYPRGTTWNYSSGAFVVLGEVVSRVSGMGYEDYVTENIFKPLGMDRSFFNVPKALWDEVCVIGKEDFERLAYVRDPEKDPTPAGGGIYSTTGDLCNFARMMLNKGTYMGAKILGRKTVEFMTRNQLDHVSAYNWNYTVKNKEQGITWNLFSEATVPHGTYSHDGAGCCSLYIDPSDQFTVAFFVPTRSHWCADAVLGTIDIAFAGIE